VNVIKKGDTACYECEIKPTQKVRPVHHREGETWVGLLRLMSLERLKLGLFVGAVHEDAR
jgi:hypothetical protein